MVSAELILIVIPCLNEEKHLERLVRGVIAGCKTFGYRLVIADGGSVDRTPEIARKLAGERANIFLVNNPKRLQSAGINLAVRLYGSGCEWMIRLDAHADYPPDFFEVLIDEARSIPEADCVVVAMDTVGKAGFQKAVAAAQNSKIGNGGSAHRSASGKGAWVDHGHHALISLAAFQAVGGYDEKFSHNEDAELDARLVKAGYKIWLTRRTRLVYYPRAALIPLFLQYMGYGAGRARNMLRHRAWPKLRQIIPVGVFPAFLGAAFFPFCFWAKLPLIVWGIVCLLYGVVLGARERETVIFLSGVAAMIMHMGWSIGFWRGLFDYARGRKR